MKKFYGIS